MKFKLDGAFAFYLTHLPTGSQGNELCAAVNKNTPGILRENHSPKIQTVRMMMSAAKEQNRVPKWRAPIGGFILFIFQIEEKGGREGEKHRLFALHRPPTGDLAHNTHMFPDP